MDFFNSLSIRIPLALLGGFLYSLLTCAIILHFALSSELALFAAFIVFFFYLVSRFVLLFSGIPTPYYSKEGKTSVGLYENTHFYRTAQWVGKFYHYHDIVLFILLVVFAISFVISLVVDWWSEMPFGRTLQHLWNSLIPMP